MNTRIATVATLSTLAAVLTVAPAATSAGARTSGRIAPNQTFVGSVNHNNAKLGPAQVRVACPGPVQQGRTTHPLAHQPLEVVRAANSTGNGSTGPHGTRITAYLGIPPAGASATPGALPTFTHYGAPQPIPTSINVPCSGKGYITFMPWPRDPGMSRAYVVPIEYVNVAA